MSNETTLGDWTFHTDYDHPFTAYEGRPLYGYTTNSETRVREWYPSIEYAMAAAIADKHTGPHSSAAGWFMRMIGAPTE